MPKQTAIQRHIAERRAVQETIPASKADRNRLLQSVQEYVQQHRPVPPMGVDELKQHTDAILAKESVPEIFRNWLVVLLSNEVWRDHVAKIPFDRRLLLLPKCLRDAKHCQGEIDTFGLVCHHCGNCLIHEIENEAKALGYAVMVAEGSPVVMAMIESGQIEGVIGVSCLATLEMVFPYMDAAAVPGIAIPLLQDGCQDTSVDLDWVWDVIHMSSVSEHNHQETDRMRMEALQDEVETWFKPSMLSKIMGPAQSDTNRAAMEWLSKSGKRWRPYLAGCVYDTLVKSESPLPIDLAKIAVAVECFHKASLIHDDIEDHDPLRYGEKTMHEEYGLEIALNTGDFLLGEGYRLIGEVNTTPEQKVRLLQTAALGHRTLCLGQGAELFWQKNPNVLTIEQVIEIFRGKTVPAFEVALHFGAIYAGADHTVCDILSKYSEALGIGYQIYDDLDDFINESEINDIGAMRPSILPAIAYQKTTGQDQELLSHFWHRRENLSDELLSQIRTIIIDSKAVQIAESMLEYYKNLAIRTLSEIPNARLKSLLRRVLSKIFNDIETMGCCIDYQRQHSRKSESGQESA